MQGVNKVSGVLRFIYVLYIILFTAKILISQYAQLNETNGLGIIFLIFGAISLFLVFGLVIYYNIIQAQKELDIKNYVVDQKLRKLSVFGSAFMFSVVFTAVLASGFSDMLGLFSLFIIGFIVFRDAFAIPKELK